MCDYIANHLILRWSNLSENYHNILYIAKLTCPFAEMSSIVTLRNRNVKRGCHYIKFWIKLTYERSILKNPAGLWAIDDRSEPV